MIVRNNEGQLFHSYILSKWSTQGNGTPFGLGQKRALCIGRVSPNGGNYVFPMTRLTLNCWFKSPTQSPLPHQKKKIVTTTAIFAKNSIIIKSKIWSRNEVLTTMPMTTCMLAVCQLRIKVHLKNLRWGEYWLFNVTINDISVIHVMAHRCAGGMKKKLYLRSGSQRHRHCRVF